MTPDHTHYEKVNISMAHLVEMQKMISDRDAVLRQALEALESQKAYIEANEPGLATTVPVIAAIRDVLK